jgi:dinuclear metal center YbgI/SA1388 family protein
MKTDRKQFEEIMDVLCPPELAEAWDNCGYQIRTGAGEIGRILVALEVTDEVVDEAIRQEADLILTHHPLIFGGITSVDDNNITERMIIRLIKNDISVFSCHTSFDKVSGGNNDYLGKILGFEDVRPVDEDGFLRTGILPEAVTFAGFAEHAAEVLGVDKKFFSMVGDPEAEIRAAAWCTGSGAEFMRTAAEEGCGLFITGDLKYHDAQNAKAMGLCVLDAGHFGTENIFTANMAELLSNELKRKGIECDIIQSVVDINPFV